MIISHGTIMDTAHYRSITTHVLATLALAGILGGCAVGSASIPTIRETSTPVRQISREDLEYARDYFLRGTVHQMQQKYATAIEDYNRTLQYDTTSATYYAIARCFRAMNKLDSAVFYARRAVRLDTSRVDARSEFAELLAATGAWDAAAAQYEKVTSLNPDDIQAHFMIARIWQRRDPQQAIEHYEYIRNYLDDGNYEVLLSLAELYMNNRNYDRAAEVLRQALALLPGDTDLYRLLANVYMESGRHDDARGLVAEVEVHSADSVPTEEYYVDQLTAVISRLTEHREIPESLVEYGRTLAASALTVLPNAWRPRLYSGLVFYHLQDTLAYADSLIASALADSASTPGEWTEVAETYLHDQQFARAVEVLATTTGRFARNPKVPLLMGRACFMMGELDSAERYTRLSLDAREENGEAWEQMARIYEAQKKIGPSDMAYERALFYDPSNPRYMSEYAHALAARDARLEWALELARQALQQDSSNEEYIETVGFVYFHTKDYRTALGYFKRAVAAGGASSAWELLGDTHHELGNVAEAQDAYSKALESNPANPYLQQKLQMISQATPQ